MVEIEARGRHVRAWKNAPPSLRDMVEASREFADRDFLVYGDERMTYGEHYRRVAGLTRELIDEYGIAKGDRVAIAMRNYPEWSVAFFAAACAGAIVVPLNAWWTASELSFGLRDSGSKLLIADQERADNLTDVLPELGLPLLIARPEQPLPAGARDINDVPAADELPPVELEPEDDATIFYTSGTTGTPKGAFGTHRNICGNVTSVGYSAARDLLRRDWTLEQIAAVAGEPATGLVAVPLFHGTGCHSVLLASFQRGITLVLMYKWDPGVALELIEKERVNQLTGVPTMVAQLLAHPDFARRDLSSLTTLGSGGASAPPALVARAASSLPAATVGNGYGLTETSSMTTANRGPDYIAKPDSVGLPVAICDVEVIDPVSGESLPTGEVGELKIRGANVVTGYWNRPDATADAIVDGWLHSGDLARIDEEGFVYIVDRAKDMIIRGGENIYSAEVEAAIHQHPEVADCAVIGLPHELLGEEVGAVVQLAEGSNLTADELREFLAARIAKFKIPAHIHMQGKELPRNAAGKILKRDVKSELGSAVAAGN
ncbi:class I adenylate-forming enzyme family protein [Brevibacterium daeguense]|uniref:Class I adenylate-forming enzyme family protein n=2 Tax=Brevibacterium daeguense TaxID=909936 RepID=A0ABP8EFP5_9MICO